MTEQELPLHLFVEPSRAGRAFHTLHETFIASGSQYPVEEFSRLLHARLLASPDPDMALNNFIRFVEATVSKASLFNDLLHYPVITEVLMKLFGFSQYFADILVRDPELFRWLTASDSLVKARTKDHLRSEVKRAMQMFQRPERKLDALKRLYRREVLRIGTRDILGEADLATVTRELSVLADALVDAACHIAEQQLSERFPHRPQSPYAVIGLGKLGGDELNYSSDIDILFVYKEEGEVKDLNGRKTTFHEYFNKFVEKLVQNLSQSSAEGHLYRVDTRLRPESGAGPLARAMRSFLLYYESRGELWERQMLIKARPVGGHIAFGEEFLRNLEPFVYPRTFFHNPAESITRIKARIEAAVTGEENIKLRAGGIRDIEFIVQALQLLNGGKNPRVRAVNTLQAMDALRNEGLLSDREQATLKEAYVFFRTLEHRLQTMLNTQTHSLPSDQRTQATMAKRLGLSSAEVLQTLSATHREAVKEIFDTTLSVKHGADEMNILTLIDGGVSQDDAARVLSSLGFQDPRQAAKNISFLSSGSALTDVRDFDLHAREALRHVAQQLFHELSQSPSPDMTLHNLTLLVAGQKFPGQLYAQLKEPRFRKFLLTICGSSPRFAKGLTRNPLLLETLATDPLALSGARMISPLPTASLVSLKNQEELRAGIRNLLGFTTLDELTEELSRVADVIVTAALEEECRTRRVKKVPLAVFALGKYGTHEITFDADLDIVFVARDFTHPNSDRIERMAEGVLQRLTSVSAEGKLYDVDARLRPEGKNAPLVVDKAAYETYLLTRASLWERQSLTRLRFICGDPALGKDVASMVDACVYDSPLPASWVDTVVGMRRKTETRSRTQAAEFFDLKLGPGGMVDIEFLAQMIQLKWGGAHPEVRHKGTLGVLRAARSLALSVHADEETLLSESYRMYREIEKLMRITLEERGSILPEGQRLQLLGRCLRVSANQRSALPAGDAASTPERNRDLRESVASSMRVVRSLFLAKSQSLSSPEER